MTELILLLYLYMYVCVCVYIYIYIYNFPFTQVFGYNQLSFGTILNLGIRSDQLLSRVRLFATP